MAIIKINWVLFTNYSLQSQTKLISPDSDLISLAHSFIHVSVRISAATENLIKFITAAQSTMNDSVIMKLSRVNLLPIEYVEV